MYVITNDGGLKKKFYLSIEHEANKHGFPVYVLDINKCTKFISKREAKLYAKRDDKIEKI